MSITAQQICSRCIYDSQTPRISFDEQGICNYCKMSDGLKEQYKTGAPEGERALQVLIDSIKKEGRQKKYDCVVGVSGGTDSSYTLAKVVEWGLRPLAVHFDNTWNSAIATENIKAITQKLNVDLFTYVVNNKEMDDITRSFFYAAVPELDCPTDIALAETLYRAASKFKVKYIIEGHSFIAEGVSPMGTNYFDGKYIKDIHQKFGKINMKTFPNMNFISFMKWVIVKRIKKIRPLWYIDYSKEAAKKYLQSKFEWNDYGGHHLENRLSAFTYSIYKPQKFLVDDRNWSLAAAARNGLMNREAALEVYKNPIKEDTRLKDYFIKRIGLDKSIYQTIMNGERKNYKQYATYKKRFELLRPVFYRLAKANLVPMSFYIKYTSPTEGA